MTVLNRIILSHYRMKQEIEECRKILDICQNKLDNFKEEERIRCKLLKLNRCDYDN